MQDDKEPPPFTDDEDLVETYDNQHLVSFHHLLFYDFNQRNPSYQIADNANKQVIKQAFLSRFISRPFMDFQTEDNLESHSFVWLDWNTLTAP